MANSCSASGDFAAASLSRMSSVPLASTARPDRNLSVAGLGVGSVWMNIGLLLTCAEAGLSPCTVKLSLILHIIWRFWAEVQPIPPQSRPAIDRSRHRIEVLIAKVARD